MELSEIQAVKTAIKTYYSSGYNSLGSQEELFVYLSEEFKEFDLSDKWGELIDIEPPESLQPNPNNILCYHYFNFCELPAKLEHSFEGEGDFPDIDLDFEPNHRETIKEYLKDRFGRGNCMDVVTMQGTAIKGAIQDLARIEDLLLKEKIQKRIDDLCTQGLTEEDQMTIIRSEFPTLEIPAQDVFKVTTSIKYNVTNEEQNTVEYLVETNSKVRNFLNRHQSVADNVKKMQEVIRGYGTHASAFIISSVPIKDHMPVILNKQKNLITGYTESSHTKALNKCGFIKFDILGLENLSVNNQTIRMIKEAGHPDIDWELVDINDPEIYRILNQGLNAGIFQMDGGSAAGVVSQIRPDSFEDLSAVNALCRPACLEAKMPEAYYDHKIGKFNRDSFPVWLDLKAKVKDFTFNILADTYGIPIYQEQTMAVLAEFCEVSLEETNSMRKIIGIPAMKKKPEHLEYINKQKSRFMANATKRIGEVPAKQWWNVAVGSLDYGFNASHSKSYAMIAFRQLYLKRYYPREFFCALLATEQAAAASNEKSKLMRYIIEAKQLGVPISCPDINKSKRELDYHGETIYIGFEQIKGIGPRAVTDILRLAPYDNFSDFLDKHKKGTGSKVNKRTIEVLIYSHAFGAWGTQEELLQEWYKHNLGVTIKRDEEKLKEALNKFEMPSQLELFKREHAALSTVLSVSDPLQRPYGYMSITKATETPNGKFCKIKGIVEGRQTLTSRAGKKYIKLIINDLENSAKVLVWRNQFAKIQDFEIDDIVQVELKHADSDTFFMVRTIKNLTKENREDADLD